MGGATGGGAPLSLCMEHSLQWSGAAGADCFPGSPESSGLPDSVTGVTGVTPETVHIGIKMSPRVAAVA